MIQETSQESVWRPSERFSCTRVRPLMQENPYDNNDKLTSSSDGSSFGYDPNGNPRRDRDRGLRVILTGRRLEAMLALLGRKATGSVSTGLAESGFGSVAVEVGHSGAPPGAPFCRPAAGRNCPCQGLTSCLGGEAQRR